MGWIVRVIITVLMFITNFIIIIMIRQLSSSSLSWSLRSFIMIIMIIMVMFMMVITITSSSSMKRRSLFGSSWWSPSAFWLSSSSSSWWRCLLSDICDSADVFKKRLYQTDLQQYQYQSISQYQFGWCGLGLMIVTWTTEVAFDETYYVHCLHMISLN